jgi:membrane fusion protein, multidrug efflux system
MLNRWFNATTLVFAAIVVLVVVWIGSGMIGREAPAPAAAAEPRRPTVAASWSEAEDFVRELVLYGEVQPVQIATLRARVQGIVEAIVPAGQRVAAGEVVGQLSTDDRAARLARAQAQVASAERDYEASRQLAERNITPEAEVQTLFAQLEAARAELSAVELELSYTRLTAPTGGVVNRVFAETGAFVAAGGEVAEIIDNDPLVAIVQVQQGNIGAVSAGMPARVRFIGGREAEGVVSFVSPLASAETRTFRVEVEIANSDEALPSGLSAEVVIPYASVPAHRVSPALARLDAAGRLGVHLIDADDRIAFAPVEVVQADAAGIWVTGLPDRARIVTISQGALSDGQPVVVRETPPEYLGDTAAAGEADGAASAAEAAAGTAATGGGAQAPPQPVED